jgi:predicted Zn-dependent protease
MAHRALKVAGDDALVLAWIAFVMSTLEDDQAAAIVLLERAIALNPGSSTAWLLSGFVRLGIGEIDVAVQCLETSMRLDPMGPTRGLQMHNLGIARFLQGRFSEAVALEKEFLQQTEIPQGYAYLAASYGHLGQVGAAQEALSRYRALSQRPVEVLARLMEHDPAHLTLFLEGLALAEGKRQASEPTL